MEVSGFSTELLQCILTSEATTPMLSHVFPYHHYPMSSHASGPACIPMPLPTMINWSRSLEGLSCSTPLSITVVNAQPFQGAFLRWKNGSLGESLPSSLPLGFTSGTESHSTTDIILSQIPSTSQNLHMGLNTDVQLKLRLWCLSPIVEKNWEECSETLPGISSWG